MTPRRRSTDRDLIDTGERDAIVEAVHEEISDIFSKTPMPGSYAVDTTKRIAREEMEKYHDKYCPANGLMARIDLLEKRISDTLAFQNKIIGALAVLLALFPLWTWLLARAPSLSAINKANAADVVILDGGR